MSPWRFYWLAVLALAMAGYFAVEARSGSPDPANSLGICSFVFVAALSIGVGNAWRLANRRLRALEDAQGEGRGLRETVADLQRCLEKQAMLVRAIFTLLSAKHDLTEAELVDRFRRVEKERAGAAAKKCAQCGRNVNQRTHRCLYCGAPCEVESAFEFLELGTWPNPSLQPTGPALRPPEQDGVTSRPGG
jgi:hypothetical protein